MHARAARLSEQTRETVVLPSYDQVRKEVHRLRREPELVAMREGAKALLQQRKDNGKQDNHDSYGKRKVR